MYSDSMKLFLHPESSLPVWRSELGELFCDSFSQVTLNSHSASRVSDIASCPLPPFLSCYSEERPLHILVGPGSNRSMTKSICSHQCGANFPRGSFRKLSPSVFISSPELCFTMAAQHLGFAQVVALGCELSGSYRITNCDGEEEVLFNMPSLTSRAKLESFVKRADRIKGVAKARRAAKYVLDNSASPMETALALMWHLPCKEGGYGFPRPELNYFISLSMDQQIVAQRFYCKGDIVFPEKHLIVEYDSSLCHAANVKLVEDARRRNALIAEGYEIVSITKDQLYDPLLFDRVSNAVARSIGHRQRTSVDGLFERRRYLRACLLEG